MSKVADYLQEHVVGEVMTSPDARAYFSTDASMFSIEPAIIIYPRSENDVRKVARFAWQLAERGRVIPLTARGLGSDLSGASLGNGVMIVFPAHQHRILELDSKSGEVTVEAGINYGKLQQTLLTHGRFVPCYPLSMEYSTVGGAVANNASGERGYKYGRTADYVSRLRVVLSNGEVIETGRLSKRELSKKLGLNSFEGELYRQLDALIEENQKLIHDQTKPLSAHTSGYALSQVKQKDGSFDLTPLFVGSQGTLGLVSEVTLRTESYTPHTTLVMAQFPDYESAQAVLDKVMQFSDGPCGIDFVDRTALHAVDESSPALLRDIVGDGDPALLMFFEYDDTTDRAQKKAVKKLTKLLDHHQINYRVETESDTKDELSRVRNASTTILSHNRDRAKAVPFIDDAVLPPASLVEFLTKAKELCDSLGMSTAFWGHAGTGSVHAQPFLDIAELGDRQKLYKLFDKYYELVLSMGGVPSGEHGDGRLRGGLLHKVYSEKMYELLSQVKRIFDPHGILNPGVKIDVSVDESKHLLRDSYDLGHIYAQMPRR
ncbi:FAD-binding oxidoreductase [Candidatus Saccharibacteria bacterium]|nr:FAD-binding oxidoreductase [Candidatus Saccharibacteria bacterium]